MSRRIKVLFIAGSGRSGSTLLGQILGQLPGFCFVGEIIRAWHMFEQRLCGCHKSVADCPFWTAVQHAAGEGAAHPVELRDLFAFGRLARWRHMPWLFSDDRRAASRFGESWSGGARLYEAIRTASQARVIVDSSKSPVYWRMLKLLPDLDLYVVHLLRDSRAVAYSWTRRKPDPTVYVEMNRRRPARSALYWAISNLGADFFCVPSAHRSLRLRYEDFIPRPREAIQQILGMVGEEALDLPVTDDGSVTVVPTHSVKGNPDRFRTGAVRLRLDDEWRTAMRPAERRLVTALTWPLLIRYGYFPPAM